MKLSELLSPGEYSPLTACPLPEEVAVGEIVSDTRSLTPGCLFVCLAGTRFDTHQCLSEVAAAGAAVALVEENAEYEIPAGLICLEVASTRKALALVWSRFCGEPQKKMRMIGVTGTNGKTSVATMLDTVLRAAGCRTALLGTIGCVIDGEPYSGESENAAKRLTTMTTPDPDILYPLLKSAAERGVTHVIMEVSSHALALGKVSPILFDEAVFTNLSPEHLDFHHDMESYGQAKEILFDQCRHATLNCDDAFGASLAGKLLCPHDDCGCVWVGNVTVSCVEDLAAEGVRYFYRNGRITHLLHMRFPGMFTVYNSMLAATAAISLGIPPTVAFTALENMKSIPGRMECISDTEDDIRVYIDFAHTETALRNLLKTARRLLSGTGRLVLVFGCGGDRDKTKRAPMGKCAAELADFTIVTSDNSRTEETQSIIDDILLGHTKAGARVVIPDRQRAIEYAIANAGIGDVILLAGKGHEQYEIKGERILPFDERKIALEALNTRKAGHTTQREGQANVCE